MATSGLRPNAVPIIPSALHSFQVGLTFDWNLSDGDFSLKNHIPHLRV